MFSTGSSRKSGSATEAVATPNNQAARKAAELLAERYDLSPRVDIDTFVRKFATVEPCTWPNGDVDGLTVRASQSEDLPRIFYRETQSPRRIRFTLAHELGHLILGWHIGTAQCSIDMGTAGRSPDEREADTFAASLLIPNRWVASLLAEGIGISDVVRRLEEADVSPYASLIALSNALPPGWAFELAGTVQLRSGFMPPYSPDDLDKTRAKGIARLHNTDVKWWRLFGSKDFESEVETAAAHEALLDALDATSSQLSVPQITGKVAGYLGSAKTAILQDPADMFAYVLWRLEGEINNTLPAHDGFKRWLSRRVADIAHKRASSQTTSV